MLCGGTEKTGGIWKSGPGAMKELQTVLVIITGSPGTGKSYLANQIQKRISGFFLLSYDSIKEEFFERGFDSEEEKLLLNEESLEAYYDLLSDHMERGENLIIEYPFYEKHRGILINLVNQYDYRAITIRLYGDIQTVYERARSRDLSGKRHPGHLLSCYHKATFAGISPGEFSQKSLEEFIRECQSKNYDIRIGTCIDVDVTDYKKVDLDSLISKIRNL